MGAPALTPPLTPPPSAPPTRSVVAARVERALLERNRVYQAVIDREAPRLAVACREMARRFLAGGRLLACGRGPYSTDAQHVSVEFVHPVIVGKRALPALDVSASFGPWLEAMVGADDMVMGFGPPGGDPVVDAALGMARGRGAMTFAFPGDATAVGGGDPRGSYALATATHDPFMHQELIEILYHTLWESVHVFFEHRGGEGGPDMGAAGFLYPFLGPAQAEPPDLVAEVAASIVLKGRDDVALRERVAEHESDAIGDAIEAIRERLVDGGTLILFGNGGSATDANDWAIDCVAPPDGWRPVPAVSLSMEPANVTAIANDVGVEIVFVRQLIAHARPGDIAVAISTSGGSPNVLAALAAARARGLMTVALVGYDGGEIRRRRLADHSVLVESDYIPRIQEVQASIYHIMREGFRGEP
jgi:D-sedoheptulose 7-phosphate isomerase